MDENPPITWGGCFLVFLVCLLFWNVIVDGVIFVADVLVKVVK